MAETKNISCRTSQPPCNLLLGYTAGYDRASNRLYERALHAGCRSTLFESYDSADRLRKYLRGVLKEPENDEQLPGGIECPISLRDADQERTYGLDGVGNWQETAYTRVTSEPGSAEVTTRETTQVREHDKVNQIENLDHDANGNLLGDGTHRYRYDVFNRLREVRNMAGQLIARYGYDAMGRRIRKAVVDNEEGESVRGTTSRVESVYDSLGREVRQSQTIAGRAYAVTQAEFRSYVPTKTELPNGRVIECGYDALYRKQSVGDASSEGSGDAESIAEWWFVGPGRIAATRLGNNILCSQMNNAMDRSAVQADAARPDWGDACTDHLGYDGVGRLIGKRYLSPAAPPKKMAIQITDATPIAGRFNRWEYKWRKVIPTGEGGFRADSDNITQDSEGFGPGYNTMEANNAELGVQGSGDNVSGLPESVELMPIGKNAVILDAHVVTNCVNEIEVHFSAPNNLGGSCETQE